MKISIKDKDSLLEIFNVISWLDSKRWNIEQNYNLINYCKENLTPSEEILTHWICYITDRQMPFEIIWDKGGWVLSDMVYEYSRNRFSPDHTLKKHYEYYYNSKGKKGYRFKASDGTTFASRYVTTDYESISQTLEVLNSAECNRNIITYIIRIVEKYKNSEDLLVRIACGLHLLTYSLTNKKSNPEFVIRTLNDESKFNKKLNEFKKDSTKGKKRLWCCIRDYKKGLFNNIFCEGVRDVAGDDAEEIINIWNELPMNQIELPGDVWNNSPTFRNNLFAKVVNIENIPKTWGMPTIIRDIYEQLKNHDGVKSFYPEQFDVTFDFVPRMCSKKQCNVCIFSAKGIDKICIPTEDKFCPVASFSCGYITECTDINGDCIIKNGIGKGICKGIESW